MITGSPSAPFCNSAKVSSLNLPFGFSLPWHFVQFCLKTGRISFSNIGFLMAAYFSASAFAAFAAASLAACGTAASALWRLRTGRSQRVSVDVRRAAASLVSFFNLQVDGESVPIKALGIPTIGLFPCRDGRWIHLHGGFPHLHQGTLDLLSCRSDKGSISEAVVQVGLAGRATIAGVRPFLRPVGGGGVPATLDMVCANPVPTQSNESVPTETETHRLIDLLSHRI